MEMKPRPVVRGPLRAALLAAASFSFVAAPAVAQTLAPDAAGDRAAAKRGAEQLNEQGLELYAEQDYRHALERFIGAYALERDPNLLFNLGRCYEQLGESDAALEKYQQFIAEPSSDAAGVQRARASITAILSEQASGGRQSGGPQPSTSAPVPQPSAAVITSRTDWRPWLTLSGTIAFAAAGATTYALGARDHADVTTLPQYGNSAVPAPMTWKRAEALVHSGNTKKVAGGVLLGMSGALAVVTTALFVSEGREDSPAPVAATALRGGGALLLAGSFR